MNQGPFSPLRSLRWQVWPAIVFLAWSVAAAAPDSLPADAGSTAPLAPAVSASDLDPATFREWVAGRERGLPAEKTPKGDERPATPDGVVSMGQKPAGNYKGFVYGIDKDAGPRHLRIGFTKPRKIGAVLAGGGGSLSVLSPTAAYPGDLANEEHWIPAERVVDGRPGVDEVSDRDCALWTLPAGTSTRAIRFSHQPQATDKQYSCHLTGLTILPERVLNVAPAAQVIAANPQLVRKLVDGAVNINGHWSNWDDKNQPLSLAEKSAELMLVWPEVVTVRGLALLYAGAQEVSVEEYTGPADRHPREARESDWRTIETFKELKHGYPATYRPSWLDFKKTVSTRGLRLLLQKAAVESHAHLKDSTKGGRRAWIGEILALRPIGEAPLAAGWPAEPRDTTADPPLKISVDAPADGFVTLVIDDEAGRRVRNLAGPVPVKAGKNTFAWDGLDDLGRDVGAAEHGLYHVPGAPVKPGTYAVNGIFRKAIDLRWEFGVYNPGTPPWDTADNTGSWLANHSPPQAACFVPADRSPDGKPRMYLGAYVTEGPHGFIWTDLDGKKLGGKRWLGGTWTAAPYIAHDAGPTADKNEIVFVASV